MPKLIDKYSPRSGAGESRRTRLFMFPAPGARHVQLVGDFTGWQRAPIEMTKDQDGVWRTIVRLDSCAHHYRFLVDGRWCDDPKCSQWVANPFGGRDGLC